MEVLTGSIRISRSRRLVVAPAYGSRLTETKHQPSTSS